MTEKKNNDIVQQNAKKEKPLTEVGGNTTKPLHKKAKAVKIPSLSVLQQNVKQYIIGQDKAVDRIILAIYRSLKIRTIKTNVLVIGKSGSGKTETMKQIAKALKIPYTIEDATKFTKEGYVGGNVEDIVYTLYENANKNIHKAERGMIILDEIDKKINNDSQEDISGKDVLNSLLKIVEGTKVVFADEETSQIMDIPRYIDTSKMIVVFMGAFSGIEKIREKRLKKKQAIGFGTQVQEDIESVQDMRYLKEDLIEYGMPIEFAGRIDTIVEFEQLTKESLSQIAKDSKLSIFRKYEKYLAQVGITLEYDTTIFDEMAEKAISKNTGARELSNVANEIFESILFEVFSAPKGKYKKCILQKDFVKNPQTAYVLE